jgi:hypothetical protein
LFLSTSGDSGSVVTEYTGLAFFFITVISGIRNRLHHTIAMYHHQPDIKIEKPVIKERKIPDNQFRKPDNPAENFLHTPHLITSSLAYYRKTWRLNVLPRTV